MSILAANVKPLFKELQWHQASEYTLLALLAVSLPLSWRIALWCLILLCANTLVRIFVTRHVGNPALDRPTRICLSLMMLFYLVYALSGIYSNNPHEALSTISTMLPLILFPLVFLLTDTHYLTRRHLSLLTYLMAATLTVRFIIMLIRSAFHTLDTQLFSSTTDLITALLTQLVTPAIQTMPFPELGRMIAIPPFRVAAHIFDNTMFDSRPTYLFDPLHHNYLALYILTAIALLYNELMRHWHSPRHWPTLRLHTAKRVAFRHGRMGAALHRLPCPPRHRPPPMAHYLHHTRNLDLNHRHHLLGISFNIQTRHIHRQQLAPW